MKKAVTQGLKTILGSFFAFHVAQPWKLLRQYVATTGSLQAFKKKTNKQKRKIHTEAKANYWKNDYTSVSQVS